MEYELQIRIENNKIGEAVEGMKIFMKVYSKKQIKRGFCKSIEFALKLMLAGPLSKEILLELKKIVEQIPTTNDSYC